MRFAGMLRFVKNILILILMWTSEKFLSNTRSSVKKFAVISVMEKKNHLGSAYLEEEKVDLRPSESVIMEKN